mmetsp:Transcript_36825/g.53845  ORF Transcript_36825/g.53845 Transcript_36825/m.53845 type:complete len:153 (-) Transcript_36825:592-1050(-)
MRVAYAKLRSPQKLSSHKKKTKEEINSIWSAKDEIGMKHDDTVGEPTISTNASVPSMIVHSYDVKHGTTVLSGDTWHVSDSQHFPKMLMGTIFCHLQKVITSFHIIIKTQGGFPRCGPNYYRLSYGSKSRGVFSLYIAIWCKRLRHIQEQSK